MILSPMRFGDYVWPHNPRVYEIEYKRRIVCNRVPFGLYTLSDLGRDHRVLRGEGEFAGQGAYAEFKKLASMFYLKEPKTLVHPVWQNALARLVSLKLRQEPREDYVFYEFEFWECYDGYELTAKEIVKPTQSANTGAAASEKKEYTLVKGDTLWGIAARNGLTLNQLTALNPQIRNPNIVYAGDLIYLS
jgi:LysM repeat protein